MNFEASFTDILNLIQDLALAKQIGSLERVSKHSSSVPERDSELSSE